MVVACELTGLHGHYRGKNFETTDVLITQQPSFNVRIKVKIQYNKFEANN